MTTGNGNPPTVPTYPIEVQVIYEFPLNLRVEQIYKEMLEDGATDAELAHPPATRAEIRHCFHVAVDAAGVVWGSMYSRTGAIHELQILPLIDPKTRLGEPVTETHAVAVRAGGHDHGIVEMLYRSLYIHARRVGAVSLAGVLEPLAVRMFHQDYGFMLRQLGEVTFFDGLELVAAGEDLDILEAHLRRLQPAVYEYMIEPFTEIERARFNL